MTELSTNYVTFTLNQLQVFMRYKKITKMSFNISLNKNEASAQSTLKQANYCVYYSVQHIIVYTLIQLSCVNVMRSPSYYPALGIALYEMYIMQGSFTSFITFNFPVSTCCGHCHIIQRSAQPFVKYISQGSFTSFIADIYW